MARLGRAESDSDSARSGSPGVGASGARRDDTAERTQPDAAAKSPARAATRRGCAARDHDERLLVAEGVKYARIDSDAEDDSEEDELREGDEIGPDEGADDDDDDGHGPHVRDAFDDDGDDAALGDVFSGDPWASSRREELDADAEARASSQRGPRHPEGDDRGSDGAHDDPLDAVLARPKTKRGLVGGRCGACAVASKAVSARRVLASRRPPTRSLAPSRASDGRVCLPAPHRRAQPPVCRR